MNSSLHARDIAHLIHFQTSMERHRQIGPMIITRGEGIRVFDDAGNAYIDTVSGLWSASLGFHNSRLSDAAYRQLQTLPFFHTFNHKSHPNAIELAERLIDIAPVPMSKALFQCSGSEAIDTACKLAWQYFVGLGRPEKKKIFSRIGSYHGATVAAAGLSGQRDTHRDFNLPLERFCHAESPDFHRLARRDEDEETFATRMADELEAQILSEGPENCAAMVLDPVQMSAGVIIPPRTYCAKVQAVLKRYDMLLVVDEVACGFGRTGSMWGSDTFEIHPDMLVCGKALTASFMPLSGLLISEAVYDVLRTKADGDAVFGHGFTHGTHPVTTAVALETLKIYEEIGLVDRARELSVAFLDGFAALAGHPLVRDVYGLGLAAGFGVPGEASDAAHVSNSRTITRVIEDSARREGLIVRAMGDRIAMAPPIITEKADLDEIFERFGRALETVTEATRLE